MRITPTSFCAAWRTRSALRVELFVTPCIVTSPLGEGGECDALVVPANERLQGTLFTPSECSRNLTPDTTLIYPPQVIDGLVSELGGSALAAALSILPADNRGIRCPTGKAISTPAFGELLSCYQHLIHACAPFYATTVLAGDDGDGDGGSSSDDEECISNESPVPHLWRSQMSSALRSALHAANGVGATSLAVPLLGAGARGGPAALTAEVIADALGEWQHHSSSDIASCHGGGVLLRNCLRCVRIGVQEEDICGIVETALDRTLERAPIGKLR